MSDGTITLKTLIDNTGLSRGIKAIKTGAKVATVVFGAMAVAVTKSAVKAFGEYEQLVGGVDTLFKSASGKLQEYADKAYRTAGLSANDYMQQATSFSASLVTSLGGDVKKATEIANMAMIDMSDNANKMGSDIQDIQSAYQGFAKQQYMLLDNLKLGYGGTKTEMERLLADAEKISGVKYDVENLGDVYNAIHVIQEQLGIAGTTAKEAESTIAGSLQMVKASWQNLMVGISGGGDVGAYIDNLLYSIQTFANNIQPVILRALSGLGNAVSVILPDLVKRLATMLVQSTPAILSAVWEMLKGFAVGVFEGFRALLTGETDTFKNEAINVGKSLRAGFENSAKSVNELTKATEESTKATKKNAKATKKANKDSTASYDKLRVIAKDSVGAGVGGVGSAGDVAGGSGVVSKGKTVDTLNPEKAKANGSVVAGVLSKIKALWNSIWNSDFTKKILLKILTLKKALDEAFGKFKDVFGNTFKDLWDTIKFHFGIVFANLKEFFQMFLSDLLDAMIKWFPLIANNTMLFLKDLLDSLFKPILEFASKVINDIVAGFKNAWAEEGDGLLDALGEAWNNVVEVMRNIYNNTLRPIIEPILKALDELWTNHLSGLIAKIQKLFLKLGTFFTNLWNRVLAPLVNWITEKLAPVFQWIGEKIGGLFKTIGSFLSDSFESLVDVISGVIDFVSGIFEGDWKTMFKGALNVVKGFKNGIMTACEFVVNIFVWLINGIVDGINFLIKKYNKGIDELPDWLPTKDSMLRIGLIPHIPEAKLPRYAEGGVFQPNMPFVGVLGDQRKGLNIETPLQTMLDAFNTALDKRGGTGQPIQLVVDRKVLAELVWSEEDRRYKQTGVRR